MTSSDIEIQIFTERLADHFSITPNALHRGTDDWAGLSGRSRCLLAALLSFASGWKLSRRMVDQILPECGRAAMNTVIRELKERRHLYTRRVNAGGGRFTWQWRVFLRPQPADADVFADSYAPVRGNGLDAKSAGRTIGLSQDDGSDQGEHNVSAGRTMGRSAVDGSAVDGSLGVHKKDLPEEGSFVLEEQEDPPNPRQPAVQRRVARCRDGGGRNEDPKPQKPGTIDQHDLAAAAYVAEPPTATGGILSRLSEREQQRLVDALAKRFRAGVTLKQVTEAIASRSFDGVNSIIAALISRINKLEPVPTKPQRQQVPECGQCQSRWVPVLDSEGHERWAPCPTCSPQALAKAAA